MQTTRFFPPIRSSKEGPSTSVTRHLDPRTMLGVLKGLFVVFSLGMMLCHCGSSSKEVRTSSEAIPVSITYIDPDAHKVCIAGSFNQWSPQSHCLKNERGIWSVQLFLLPGRYPYLLVIDDRWWRPDPNAPLREESGFGTENAVFAVE